MKRIGLFALLPLVTCAAHAGSRTSTNYSIITEAADAGGKRSSSVNYTNDGSAGLVAGLSTIASPAEMAKSGYVGQLYDITGLVVNAASPTVNEIATLQLAAWQFLDDTSFLAVPATGVAWSVTGGPVTGISAAGVATAGAVYQNTPATVQGSLGGFTGTLNLTVLDTIPDNFGSYAGDGVGDAWQVQYFGLNNPNAGPTVDFDGTGQTNLFKYIAGLNPLDGSRFTLTIARTPDLANPGQFLTGQKNLVFSPRFADRTYLVKSKAALSDATWSAVTVSPPTDNGQQRTVTDTAATGGRKFYHIEITKP